MLGIIGGFASLVWMTFGFLSSSYEDHKLNTSLLKMFYSTDKSVMKEDEVDTKPSDLVGSQSVQAEIEDELAVRTQYGYSYTSYFAAKLLVCFNCCCKCPCAEKRTKRLELHQESIERMSHEIDIVGLIQSLRVSSFVNKIFLDRHQRFFISKFRLYHSSADKEVNFFQ